MSPRGERLVRELVWKRNLKFVKGDPLAPYGFYLEPKFREFVLKKYNSKDQSILNSDKTYILIYFHEWYSVNERSPSFSSVKNMKYNPYLTN